MILWEIIIYSFTKSVPWSLSNKSFLPKLYFVMKFVFKGKKHCQSSLNKNKIKWNKIIKEIRRRRRRTINDFHCCKILNLNSHFAKLRSSSYFPRDHLRIKLRVSLAAARETFLAVVSHGRQLYFYLVRWNTRLMPTVMHPGALCEYQSSHEQRKLFEPKTSVSYWKLKSYVLLLFFFPSQI